MTDVQRLRQSGYDNSLKPSTNDEDAHYMFYKDHAVIVSLLREQLNLMQKALEESTETVKRLTDFIVQRVK